MHFHPPQNNFTPSPDSPPILSPVCNPATIRSSSFTNSFSAIITIPQTEQMNSSYEQCILSLENEIKSRQSQRAKLIEAIRQLESDAHTATQKQRETVRSSEQLAIAVRSLEERVKTQDVTLNDNKRVISNLTILNRQLQDTVSALRGEADRQGKGQKTLLAQLQRLQEENSRTQNEMQDKIERREKEYTAAKDEVNRLNTTLQQYSAKLSQKEAQLTASTQQHIKLQKQYAQLLQTSQKNNTNSQILFKRIEQQKKLVTEFEAAAGRQGATISRLTAQLASNQQETASLNVQLKNYQQNMQVINQQKEKISEQLNQAQRRVEELTKDNMKHTMIIEDLQLTIRDLSTNGSSLNSDMVTLKERNKELHRQIEDLKEESVDKEAEIADLKIRMGKERQASRANIQNLTVKLTKISQALSQKEIEYETLKKTSRMVKDDLEYKLKQTQMHLESSHNNLSQQYSKIESLYKNIKGESSEKIASLETVVATQKTTITQLDAEISKLKQSISRQSFEKERETILQDYGRSERNLREIIESIKQSLLSKDKELRSLEETNSILRQQNTKLLSQQAEMRKDFNLIKSSIAQATKLKHKRTSSSTHGFDALPERPDSENKYMKSSIQSAMARKEKSNFLDRKSTMGQLSNE